MTIEDERPPVADRADLARRLDTQAEVALAERYVPVTDTLSWRAAALREAAP